MAWHLLALSLLLELASERFEQHLYTGSLAEGSTLAFLALRKAKIPAELHIYSTGGHGFGMRPNSTQAPGDWPGRMELWLKAG